MAFALLYRPDGAFPAEGVVGTLLPLHEAAAGEAHELRMQLPEHVGEVGAHAVLAVFERGREEAHHVYLHLPHSIEDEGELRLRVVVVGGERCLIFFPALCLAGGEAIDHGLGIEL